jgi:hypothetical protein
MEPDKPRSKAQALSIVPTRAKLCTTIGAAVMVVVPGGITFNSAAILNYDGFPSILKLRDGVDMYVDEEVWSIHYDRNGSKARYGDYGRRRHQQQLLKVIAAKMTTAGVITDLGKIQKLHQAGGDLLTLDLGGVPVEQWLFTLKSLGPDDLVMMRTNAGQFNSAGDGNEQLSQDSLTLLRHVRQDTVLDFLTTHRDWIASDECADP